ncbi:MAG: acyl carrier protein [Chromatiales bacterium 21-64-14]|nr:MAG: acyl carrier protein [Chromatiales bacterium 21-64-14]HQU14657.1 phosphopantetheine-binding protein [Gammaproteobacteria bacterium]
MSEPTTTPADAAFLHDVAQLIVTSLNLEISPSEIQPDAPLYGDGLGLDSIDILELAMALSKRYGVQLRADGADNHRIFSSLRNLADHVAAFKT